MLYFDPIRQDQVDKRILKNVRIRNFLRAFVIRDSDTMEKMQNKTVAGHFLSYFP